MNALFGDYGHFFASETFTCYHYCSQHWSGYGQPEAMVKYELILTQTASRRQELNFQSLACESGNIFGTFLMAAQTVFEFRKSPI